MKKTIEPLVTLTKYSSYEDNKEISRTWEIVRTRNGNTLSLTQNEIIELFKQMIDKVQKDLTRQNLEEYAKLLGIELKY